MGVGCFFNFMSSFLCFFLWFSDLWGREELIGDTMIRNYYGFFCDFFELYESYFSYFLFFGLGRVIWGSRFIGVYVFSYGI